MNESFQGHPAPQPPLEPEQPQHEMADITFEWLSARVAELNAEDDRLSEQNPASTAGEVAQRREELSRQMQELGEQALDFARRKPETGKALFEAMTMSDQDADQAFIAYQMADYTNIEGQVRDGIENFASLLLSESDRGSEAAEFALHEAADHGKLNASQVAGIATEVARSAQLLLNGYAAKATPSGIIRYTKHELPRPQN